MKCSNQLESVTEPAGSCIEWCDLLWCVLYVLVIQGMRVRRRDGAAARLALR